MKSFLLKSVTKIETTNNLLFQFINIKTIFTMGLEISIYHSH